MVVRKIYLLIALVVGFFCFLLDLFSKSLARSYLPLSGTRKWLPGLLHLTLVNNTGAAFSLGRNSSMLITALATLVFLGLLTWFIREHFIRQKFHCQAVSQVFLEELGLAMILGAALGNLVDRYTYGKVTDFLAFDFIDFPVFNLADVFIDLGIVLVILSSILKQRLERPSQTNQINHNLPKHGPQ